jgi:heme/copper-type cytochrome/quinol oxidase subunit 3
MYGGLSYAMMKGAFNLSSKLYFIYHRLVGTSIILLGVLALKIISSNQIWISLASAAFLIMTILLLFSSMNYSLTRRALSTRDSQKLNQIKLLSTLNFLCVVCSII